MKASAGQQQRGARALRPAMPLFAHGGRHPSASPGPAGGCGAVSTGLAGLDQVLGGGFAVSRLGMVAARARMGASSLLVGVALAAMKRGQPVAFFSERTTERRLKGRMVVLEARVNGYRVAAGLAGPEDRIALAAARERIPWGALSTCVHPRIDPFELEEHLYTYRPRLVIADLRPRSPDAHATPERFATLAEGTRHLARLAAEHGTAVVLRWVLPLGDALPAVSELPGRGALAEAVDTLLLVRKLEPEPPEGDSYPGAGGPAAPPGLAEVTLVRQGGREIAPRRVPLVIDQRFGAVSDAPALVWATAPAAAGAVRPPGR